MGVTVGALPWANAVNQASWQRSVSQTSVSGAARWATSSSAGHLESFLSGWPPTRGQVEHRDTAPALPGSSFSWQRRV